MISKNQLKYVRQLEQKKYRKREGLFVAEGVKVVNDLLLRYQPKMLFATHEYLETHPLQNATFETIEVSTDELTRLSFLQHPQQVLALFPIPTINYNLSTTDSQLSLALDGVQDPGNLGTIIRIADWFGIENIYCSEDTVDAWNPKVVQATMGSISRVNLIYIDLLQMLDNLPSDFPVYGTFLDGKNIYEESLSQEGLVIMGNEGNGISDAVRSRVNRRLLIPDFHQGETADSLNVAIATAITCSEFRRRK
jgi:TrmH family RNA methyltransferase